MNHCFESVIICINLVMLMINGCNFHRKTTWINLFIIVILLFYWADDLYDLF